MHKILLCKHHLLCFAVIVCMSNVYSQQTMVCSLSFKDDDVDPLEAFMVEVDHQVRFGWTTISTFPPTQIQTGRYLYVDHW